MSSFTANTVKKACLIYEIVQVHYEEGNQRRCQRQVYKKHVLPIYPISEPTFWRLMRIAKRYKEQDKTAIQ